MKPIVLLLLIVSILAILVPCVQANGFLEDFESINSFPSTNWGYHTCYNPGLVPGIDTSHGNPGHCYVPDGAGHGQNSEIYRLNYLADYSDGFIMECDFYFAGTSSHYTDLAIGLPRIPIVDGINLEYSVYLTLTSRAGQCACHGYIGSDDPNHQEQFDVPQAFTAGNWYRVGIAIRPDQQVEFYLDDELVYASTKTIDPAYNLSPPVLHGFNAHPVYADNFHVGSYPKPICSDFITCWSDDFESYSAGTYPSAGGWTVKWSGQGAQVTNSSAAQGAHSFSQTDGASNVRGDLHTIEYNSKFRISVDYMRDVTDTGSALHLWQNNTTPLNVFTICHTTGEILVFGNSTGHFYEFGQWIKLTVEADFDALVYSFYLNDFCIQTGDISSTIVFDALEISTGNNPGGRSCYWDNITYDICNGFSTDSLWAPDAQGCNDHLITINVMQDNLTTAVDTFSFSVDYDTDMLEFVTGAPGALNSGWTQFSCNETVPGSIDVSGLTPTLCISPGQIGSIAELTFCVRCNNCQWQDSSGIILSNPGGDVNSFATVDGLFTYNCCIHSGDVNNSGNLSAGDAQLAYQIAVEIYSPTEQEHCAADCNNDANVTAGDAMRIFAAALGGIGCDDPVPEPCLNNSASRFIFGDIELKTTIKNDQVECYVLVSGNKVCIDAFTLELKFDSELLEFSKVASSDLDPGWVEFGGSLVTDNVLVLGGFALDSMTVSKQFTLANIAFTILKPIEDPHGLITIEKADDDLRGLRY